MVSDTRLPVTFHTPLGSELSFVSLTGYEGLSQPFLFEVEASSTRSDIDAGDLLGQLVTINLGLVGMEVSERSWNGRVVRMRYLDTDPHGNSHYQLTLRPWLWQLTLSADCRIFQDKTVLEILTEVFGRYASADFESHLSETYPSREYVVQYRETDFQFVSRLLEREGIYYFFRHRGQRHTLVLADSLSAYEVLSPCGAVPFATTDTPKGGPAEVVRRWSVEAQVESGAYAHADYDFTHSLASLYASQASPHRLANAELRVYDHPGGFSTFAEADASVRVRLEQARRRAVRASGETNARKLTVGATMELVEHPRRDQNRKYLVVSASYRVRGQVARSVAESSVDAFQAAFSVIDTQTLFRPPFSLPRLTVRGPQTATVVGPGGREIWTDDYGRVKIQFHWDRQGQRDHRSSCWVRVAQAWAGTRFGAQFVPRIGQEVVVDFLDGDPDRPIITGSVYNSSNLPPFELPEHQTQSGIRTRSTPSGSPSNGNEIRFEDLRGNEDLYIQAERTQTTLIKSDQSISIGGSRTLEIAAGESVTVGLGRSTQVAGVDARVVGGASSETIGGMSTSVVGGARHDSVGAGYALKVAADWVAHSGGTTRLDVDGAMRVAVLGDASYTTGGNVEVRVGDKASQLFAADTKTVVGHPDREANRNTFLYGAESLHASKAILIESDTSILLKCGDTKLTITPQGVTIEGDELQLKAGSKLAASASSSVLTLDSNVVATGSKVKLSSSGASLDLSATAKLVGAKVQLGSGSGASASSSSSSGQSTKDKPVYIRTKILRSGKPVAGVAYKLVLDTGLTLSGSTTAAGLVEQQVPATVASAELTLLDINEKRKFTIGAVEAFDTILGAQQRLKRLGFYHGPLDGSEGSGLSHAVAAFQKKQGQTPTGALDAATQAALKSQYGS
ncbi:MAG TPA: type VI secretion system tip protein TssI/VgrG [Polyangiaceae bacterium]|nr:type VI secretion system tip protein TssI/VgrG [Polyangiaceae bacterium]